MPTYDYVCTACNNAWEEVQKISADALTDCPKCGQATAKRQISGGNFILKGGGWYADLYSSAKPSGGSSGESKGESKPATTTESKPSGGDTSAPAAPSAPKGDTK